MVDIRSFRWSPVNVAHAARHGVTAGEIEDVCKGPFMMKSGFAGRLLLIGPTSAGRMLGVVVEAEP